MRWSLTTSLVLHASILVAALVVLPNPDAFEIKPQTAIQVDISKIGDVSKQKAMTKTPEKPKDKPARGYARLYADSVLQAEDGCDFSFLRG